MVEFKSVSKSFDNVSGDVKSTIKADFGDHLELKVTHSNLTNSFVVEADVDKWKFKYDVAAKGLWAEVALSTKVGKLKVLQHVPKLQWALVPSPVYKLTFDKFDVEDWKHSVTATYDTFQRKVSVLESMKRDRHKATVQMDRRLGKVVVAAGYRWQCRKGPLHTLSASAHSATGVLLGAKLTPCDGLKVAAKGDVTGRRVLAHIKYRPGQAKSTELSLESLFDLASPGYKPTTRFTLTCDL